uniref:VPS39 subunit of HOPS complex n=1 Tax=Rousettus aegyptiacus TaxID=9407 RepID=A0A7J8IUU9_ROUAE|nr:VPS39 subunit of HOPS complex [Rousettus aegyptiacus]
MKDDSDSEKQQQIHHIKNLYAFNLFCQKRFDESMQVFAKLGTDPTHVMGLYPDLLPTDYRKQLQYPNPLPGLSGAELEKAHLALIDYLTQVGIIERCMEEFTWEFSTFFLMAEN